MKVPTRLETEISLCGLCTSIHVKTEKKEPLNSKHGEDSNKTRNNICTCMKSREKKDTTSV